MKTVISKYSFYLLLLTGIVAPCAVVEAAVQQNRCEFGNLLGTLKAFLNLNVHPEWPMIKWAEQFFLASKVESSELQEFSKTLIPLAKMRNPNRICGHFIMNQGRFSAEYQKVIHDTGLKQVGYIVEQRCNVG